MDAKKILVVDDKADDRRTLQEICHLAGWHLVEADTVGEGLSLLKKAGPDLIILDGGVEAVRQIRFKDPLTPIMVLTGDGNLLAADALLTAGASDFALKPVRAPDLTARIKVHLSIAKVHRHRSHHMAKGISSATLGLIQEFMERSVHPVAIEEIAGGVDLAYQTVHRYLHHLVEEGRVVVKCEYGRIGRPKNRYRLS